MSVKDLKYYLNIDYPIVIEKDEYEGEQWYIAYSKELGKYSCYGRGSTKEEALKSFEVEKASFIEMLLDMGKPIPEPDVKPDRTYSGFFNVRTSPFLHEMLVEQAKENNVSLNLYLNQLLAIYVGGKQKETELAKLLENLSSQLKAHNENVLSKLNYNPQMGNTTSYKLYINKDEYSKGA